MSSTNQICYRLLAPEGHEVDRADVSVVRGQKTAKVTLATACGAIRRLLVAPTTVALPERKPGLSLRARERVFVLHGRLRLYEAPA